MSQFVFTGRIRDDGKGTIGTKGDHGWCGAKKGAVAGSVIKQTVPGPCHKIRRYEAIFTLANSEADYCIAWNFFGRSQREPANVAVQSESRP